MAGSSGTAAPVARLAKGKAPLRPRIDVLDTDLLDPGQRDRIARRLEGWIGARIERDLAPLVNLPDAELAGPARGIAFQVAESTGTVKRTTVAEQIAALKPADRKALRAAGVRIGRASVFLPGLLGKRADTLRRRLVAAHYRAAPDLAVGAAFAEDASAAPAGFWLAAGYIKTGTAAIRADALERLAAEAFKLGKQGPFSMTAAVRNILGAPDAITEAALAALGFRAKEENGVVSYALRRKRPTKPAAKSRKPGKRKTAAKPEADPASPFAKLKELNLS